MGLPSSVSGCYSSFSTSPTMAMCSSSSCFCSTVEGERAVRCRWQMQHGERVAAVKFSSDRRKAAQKIWVTATGATSQNRPCGLFWQVNQSSFSTSPTMAMCSSSSCFCSTVEGERAVRCRWQMQHGERVAAVKFSSDRRKAAQKIWVTATGATSQNRPCGLFWQVDQSSFSTSPTMAMCSSSSCFCSTVEGAPIMIS